MITTETLVIDLLLALQKDDIEQTKELVHTLKTSVSPALMEPHETYDFNNPEEENLEILLGLGNQHYPLYHQSIEYVLNNLNHLHNSENLKFDRKILNLIAKRDIAEIKEFITSQIQQKTYNISDKKLQQGILKVISAIGPELYDYLPILKDFIKI